MRGSTDDERVESAHLPERVVRASGLGARPGEALEQAKSILLGHVLLDLGLVDLSVIREAVAIQESPKEGRRLGRILVDQGKLSEAALARGVAVQQGRLASREGSSGRPLGERIFGSLAIELGLLDRELLNCALREQEREERGGRKRPIGEVLVSQGALGTEDVDRILGYQATVQGEGAATWDSSWARDERAGQGSDERFRDGRGEASDAGREPGRSSGWQPGPAQRVGRGALALRMAGLAAVSVATVLVWDRALRGTASTVGGPGGPSAHSRAERPRADVPSRKPAEGSAQVARAGATPVGGSQDLGAAARARHLYRVLATVVGRKSAGGQPFQGTVVVAGGKEERSGAFTRADETCVVVGTQEVPWEMVAAQSVVELAQELIADPTAEDLLALAVYCSTHGYEARGRQLLELDRREGARWEGQ